MKQLYAIAPDYFELTWDGIELAGVDEVGRGALIGPVVTAAVLLQPADCPALIAAGVQDSKKLSAKRREELFPIIQTAVRGYCVASATAAEIDQINIRRATLLAMQRAVQGLNNPPELCLVDGRDAIPELQIPQQTLISGDNRSVAIAAASILAKVTRDRLLVNLAHQYPQYGLERHKGYGTAQHREALKAHGPTPEHRRSFLGKILDLTALK